MVSIVIGTNFYTALGLFGVCSITLLGLVSTYPAVKAFEKGRNFIKWYLFSFSLFPFALASSFYIKKTDLSRYCTFQVNNTSFIFC
jgi:hypothetical protein